MRPHTFLMITTLCVAPSFATADAVTDTCALYDAPEVCDCATKALMEALSAREFAYYAAAAGTALEQQKAGTGLVEAWDIARDAHAQAANISKSDALDQMNAFGKAHRDAIKGCKN